MFDRLFEILKRSPVDMSSITNAAGVAGEKQLLIAGDVNASVLSLLGDVGAGCPELTAVQQPCVVEVSHGSEESLLLAGEGGSMRCSSLSDLGTRLSWPENRGAAAALTLPHDLFGFDKLVFAILDGDRFADQLSARAPAARGAVIVLNAYEAPQKAVYDYAKWLAEACGLSGAAAVVVQGKDPAAPSASAMMCALQMGVAELPVFANDPEQPAAGTLTRVLESLPVAAGADEQALERAMAQRACKLLEEEKQRLAALAAAPAPRRRKLAECFEAEIPVARMRIGQLFTEELSNQLYSEMRDFGIFLQQNITDLLVSGVAELEAAKAEMPEIRPKDALRAFTQSYLDELLFGFSRQLVSGLSENILLPKAREIYARMFEWAWIDVTGTEAAAMAQLQTQELHTTVDKLQQRGNSILSTLLTYAILFLCPELSRSNRVISAIHVVVEMVVSSVRESLTPASSIARSKGKQLEEVLGGIIAQYQTMVIDTMIPQLRDSLLGWFDDQCSLTLRELARCDGEQEERIRSHRQSAEENRTAIALIDGLLGELAPWQA